MRFIFVALLTGLLLSVSGDLQAQRSSSASAVMTVSVRIIKAPGTVEAKQPAIEINQSEEDSSSFGELTLPDRQKESYLFHHSEEIVITNDKGERFTFQLNSLLSETSSLGNSYRLVGAGERKLVKGEEYSGQITATLEYF